jgi:peptide/nickel transport system ATP-binding protein
VSLEIPRGQFCFLVGASGSGKSTLLSIVLREERATGGKVFVLGQDLSEMPGRRIPRFRRQIGAVFQDFRLLERKTVFDNVAFAMQVIGRPRHAIMRTVPDVLDLVGLADKGKRTPHELSGGMLQRVMIAISLLHEPDLLILDEATTALDVVTQGQIIEELKKMENELMTSRIVITHDMSVVSAGCNKIAVMYAGHMLEAGYVRDVMSSPAHPYTEGLIAAFPPLKGERVTLKSIRGQLPDMSVRHEGCIFAPRCDSAVDKCRRETPPRKGLGKGRVAACHFAGS